MQPFFVNRHERIVFPSNFIPELDFSVMDSLEQLDIVIRRAFGLTGPTARGITHGVEGGAAASR